MTHVELTKSPQKRILLKCLIATIGIHVVAFFYFYQFPPGLPYAWHQMFVDSLPILRFVPQEEENKLLEEVFDPFPDISAFYMQPYDMIMTENNLHVVPKEEAAAHLKMPQIVELTAPHADPISLDTFATTFSFDGAQDMISLALPESFTIPVPTINNALSEGIALAPLAPDEEVEESFETPAPIAYPQKVGTETKKEIVSIPQMKLDPMSPLYRKKEVLSKPEVPVLPLLQDTSLSRSTSSSPTSSLATADHYNLPQPKTIEIAPESLQAEVRLGKTPGTKGKQLFTITLKPTKNAALKTMQQNYTFLIDRSNSIEKHHFTSFKKATLRALSMLQPEDTFNIVVFDKKAVHFSKKPVYYSKETLEEAQAFLNKQQHGGLFAAADLYETLLKILPNHTPDDEVNTVILLTDGTSDAKPKKQKAFIEKLINTNKKKLTLYTAAVGKDNNLKLLELVSGCTGGSLLYSDTYAAFPRRLAGLVYRLREPLAKDIVVSVLSHDTHHKLFTPPTSVFHAGQPYEIVAETDHLEDFTLLIEGVHEGEAVRIKKKISFAHAKKDNAYVNKKWTLTTNRIKYEKQLAKK